MLPPVGPVLPVNVAGLPETGDHSDGKRIDQPDCSTCWDTWRWITRSGWSSTHPSALPPSDFTCSHVSWPTVLFSEMSSRTPWATVAIRVALRSAELWMLRPTGLTTHTELLVSTVCGSAVTAMRPDEAAPGFDGGVSPQAAPSTSPRAPQSVNRIIGVTLPLEGKSTLGRHPSRRSRHPHAVPHPEGAAPAGRAADDRPAARRLRRRRRRGSD